MAVQDRCLDTVLANDGPAADDLTVIRLEVVAAVVVRVCHGEKMAKEAVVVEIRLVQHVKVMVMEEIMMGEVQARQLHEGERQTNPAAQAIIRTFCDLVKT